MRTTQRIMRSLIRSQGSSQPAHLGTFFVPGAVSLSKSGGHVASVTYSTSTSARIRVTGAASVIKCQDHRPKWAEENGHAWLPGACTHMYSPPSPTETSEPITPTPPPKSTEARHQNPTSVHCTAAPVAVLPERYLGMICTYSSPGPTDGGGFHGQLLRRWLRAPSRRRWPQPRRLLPLLPPCEPRA